MKKKYNTPNIKYKIRSELEKCRMVALRLITTIQFGFTQRHFYNVQVYTNSYC